jgi:hypothetical protein
MLINVTSTDQTFDISISDGGASVILGDKGIGSRKRLGGRDVISRRKILQILRSPIRYFMRFRPFYDNLHEATDLVYFIS